MRLILSMVVIYISIRFGQANTINGLLNRFKNTMGHRKSSQISLNSAQNEDDIHLYIWNDLQNRENFYPNLMKHVRDESDAMAPSQSQIYTGVRDPDEVLPASMPIRSPFTDSMQSAILQTLDAGHYRKNDETNNNNYYGTINDKRWNILRSASIEPLEKRPTFNRLKMGVKKSLPVEYYTKKLVRKPDSIINTIGYEIGGLPKYSGRLLADEPLPQYHHTFRMFEPVPRQLMLPPTFNNIPEFKPVPPRLTIIPVIDDYLNSDDLPHTEYVRKDPMIGSQRTLMNYEQKTMKPPTEMIPFVAAEAITNMPIRNFAPETEGFLEATTKPYHYYMNTNSLMNKHVNKMTTEPPVIENIRPALFGSSMQTTTLSSYADLSRNSTMPNVVYAQSQTTAAPIWYGAAAYNKLLSALAKAQTKPRNKQKSDSTNIGVNVEMNSFNDHEQQQIEQKHVENPNNRTDRMPVGYKTQKLSGKRKVAHRGKKRIVTRLNVDDVRASSVTHIPLDNKTSRSLYAAHSAEKDRLLPFGAYVIDSSPAASIQLSKTYSKQTTNVRADDILMNWPIDPNTIQKVDVHNNTSTKENPFLIAVYDSNSNTPLTANKTSNDIDRSDAFVNDTITQSHGIPDERKTTNWSIVRRTNGTNAQRTNRENQPQQQQKNKVQYVLNNESKPASNHRYTNNTSNHLINSNAAKRNTTAATEQRTIDASGNVTTVPTINEHKYYDWFSAYAKKSQNYGRHIFSEHFKKVEIEPNVAWVTVPR